jgi:hypothetical protein
MVHTTLVAIDENMPNINKTKHPSKNKERYKREGPKSKQKEKTTNEGILQLEHEQIKYLNPSPSKSQGACHIRRGEEHLKKHLA